MPLTNSELCAPPSKEALAEPFWTLAMVLTWIIWRTERAVRENTLSHRSRLCPNEAYDTEICDVRAEYDSAMMGLPLRLSAGRNGEPVDAAAFSTPPLFSFDDALSELETRLMSEELIARGIHDHSVQLAHLLHTGREYPGGEPLATNDEGRIPGSAWRHLVLENPHFCGHPSDIARMDDPLVPRYRSVGVKGEDVLKLWPPGRVEFDVEAFLRNLIRENPRLTQRQAEEIARGLGAIGVREKIRALWIKVGGSSKTGPRGPRGNCADGKA